MDQNKTPRPNKLLTGILFLFLAIFMVVLSLGSYVWCIEQVNSSEVFDLKITYQTILLLIVQIWLLYNIIKGINWSRYYFLIFIVVGIPKLWLGGTPYFDTRSNIFLLDPGHSFYLDFYKATAIELMHDLVPFVFVIIGLILLFSKDSSGWFKQIKQTESYKKTTSNSIKISSICLYIAYGITVLSYMVFIFDKTPTGRILIFLYLLGFLLLIIISINILFIYAISRGSRLVGIIYLIFITITQLSCYMHLTTYFDLHDLFLAARPYNLSYGVLIGFIQIPIQLVGFIFLFQNDIIKCFNKFFKQHD